jgi:hypothetical protein
MSIAFYPHRESPLLESQVFSCKQNARADRARSPEYFCLRQIERVFRFDISRSHIITKAVTKQFSFRARDYAELWFRNSPLRVTANADDPSIAHDIRWEGFEK